MNQKFQDKLSLMSMSKIITFVVIFLCSHSLFSQENYEGYIICIDNLGLGDLSANEYYYIPSNYLENKEVFHRESLENPNDKLEASVRRSNGAKIYKNIYTFRNESCMDFKEEKTEYYAVTNFNVVYFHYKADNFPIIDKGFFLKKIKKKKFYLAKIKFSGCKLVDNDYLKSKVLKIFIYKVEEIIPASLSEQHKIELFIKNSYCE